MNKALRQFLVFFIVICIVFLAVFTIQVFVVGKKAEQENGKPDVISSETPPEEESESPDEPFGDTESPPTDDLPAPPDVTDNQTDTNEPPEIQDRMSRVTLTLPGHGTLLIDYFTELFEHVEQGDDDVFLYISPDGGNASMSVSPRAGQSAKEVAANFFDGAEDSGGPLSAEARSVGRTELTGQYVTTKLGEDTYEVWAIEIDGGVVAFSIKYENESQKAALHEMVEFMLLMP